MNKILVEIFLPASGENYDVFIPLDSRMSEVLAMASSLLSELSGGKYKASHESVLCDAASGVIYNINLRVAELGLKTGSRLMLI